jgi:hypothetical protein
MNDTSTVSFPDRECQFSNQQRRLSLRERFALPEVLGQRLPLDTRHRNEVCAVDRSHIKNRADVGMPECGGKPRLTIKPIQQHLLVGAGELGRFQRDLSLEVRVLRQATCPHCSLSQGSHKAISPQSLGDRSR